MCVCKDCRYANDTHLRCRFCCRWLFFQLKAKYTVNVRLTSRLCIAMATVKDGWNNNDEDEDEVDDVDGHGIRVPYLFAIYSLNICVLNFNYKWPQNAKQKQRNRCWNLDMDSLTHTHTHSSARVLANDCSERLPFHWKYFMLKLFHFILLCVSRVQCVCALGEFMG